MTKVIGFGLIATAITVITYSILGFPKMEVSLWPLFPVVLFAFFAIENLIKKDYKSSLMNTLIGLMIANAIYDLLPISNDCCRNPNMPRPKFSFSKSRYR